MSNMECIGYHARMHQAQTGIPALMKFAACAVLAASIGVQASHPRTRDVSLQFFQARPNISYGRRAQCWLLAGLYHAPEAVAQPSGVMVRRNCPRCSPATAPPQPHRGRPAWPATCSEDVNRNAACRCQRGGRRACRCRVSRGISGQATSGPWSGLSGIPDCSWGSAACAAQHGGHLLGARLAGSRRAPLLPHHSGEPPWSLLSDCDWNIMARQPAQNICMRLV